MILVVVPFRSPCRLPLLCRPQYLHATGKQGRIVRTELGKAESQCVRVKARRGETARQDTPYRDRNCYELLSIYYTDAPLTPSQNTIEYKFRDWSTLIDPWSPVKSFSCKVPNSCDPCGGVVQNVGLDLHAYQVGVFVHKALQLIAVVHSSMYHQGQC